MTNDERLLAIIESEKVTTAPKHITLCSDHKVITIGIGPDHIATVLIDDNALSALREMHAPDGDIISD